MSRRKVEPLPLWLTKTPDGRESFTRVGRSLLQSAEFQALSAGARLLYVCMTVESKGKREFTFPLSAAKAYGIAEKSLRRWAAELEASGFITVNSGACVRAPNIYTFSFSWRAGNEE